MLQIICFILIGWLIVLFCKARTNAGIAIAIAWSTYALEQLLQQAFPALWKYSAIVNIALAAMICTAAAGVCLRGSLKNLPVPSELVALFLLLTLCGLSYFWSASPSMTVHYLIRLAPYLIVFVVITPVCATDKQAITSAVNLTAWFGGLVMIGLLFTNFGMRGVVMQGAAKEEVGNPLAIASYGAMVALCTLFIVIGKNPPFRHKIILAGVAMAATYVVMRTLSRGQLLALFASLVLWLPVTCRATLKKSTIIPILAAVFFCGVAIWGLYQFSLEGRWSAKFIAEARNDRMAMITGLLDAYRERGALTWLVGLGNSSSYRVVGYYPHNVPVEVLAEEGLLGFGLFLFFCGGTFVTAWRLMRAASIPEHARFNIGVLMAVFTFYGLLSLKEGSLIGSTYLLSTGACVVWVAPRYRLFQSGGQRPNPKTSRRQNDVLHAGSTHRRLHRPKAAA